MLAFVLGEVIAVLQWSIACVLIMLPVIIFIKIITKKQASVFVMIFLSIFAGFIITADAVNERNELYGMKEEFVSVIGVVYKINETEYGKNLFLEQVKIDKRSYHQILVVIDKDKKLDVGSRIKAEGKLIHFEGARNRGNFDSRKYYMSLGIYSKIAADNITVLNEEHDVLRNKLFEIKKIMSKKLLRICGGKYHGIWRVLNNKASIFSAILLGDKFTLDTEINNLYQISGISHILAISGLHISFIGMFVYSMLRRRFKFALSASVSIIFVVGFGIMAGMGISTIRAIVMFGLRLLGEVLGRTYDNLTAISTAGIMIMMWNPFAIFNSGFQMSFGAIIAIVLVWPIVQNILQIQRKNRVINSLLFSLNINMVMNPIIAYNYFQLPTYSFILNIIVVPLMSVVIISGLVGIGTSFISASVGRLCILPGCLILELYTKLCEVIGKIPLSNIIVGKPSITIMVIYYLILTGGLFFANHIRNKKIIEEKQKEKKVDINGRIIESKSVRRKRNKSLNRKFLVAILSLFFVLNIMIYIPLFTLHTLFVTPQKIEVTFLDVGQGDGIFMRTYNGVNIMVDGGSTSVDSVGQYRIIPFLKAQCIRNIDYAIVTHVDNDHISGLIEMVKESDNNGIKVRNVVLPDIHLKDENYNNLIQEAYQHGVNILYITRGNKLNLGSVNIKCIYPSLTTMAEDRNDYSTVLNVTYGDFSMLLTGDISMKPEAEIKDTIKSHYTVLKVAHHGSKYSTSSEFLYWINPDYSVISVGEHNLYGHPSTETLKRLRQNGSKVLRTDESGGITISTDGKKMSIESSAGKN